MPSLEDALNRVIQQDSLKEDGTEKEHEEQQGQSSPAASRRLVRLLRWRSGNRWGLRLTLPFPLPPIRFPESAS